AAGYRPLGSARNPFSGSGLQPTRSPAEGPASGGRARSSVTSSDEKTAGPFPFDTATPAVGVAVSSGEENDELTDEPTQIAGRMPSFLSADEDPTSVGSRPGGHPLGDTAFLGGGDINDEPTRITSRDVDRPGRPAEPELRSLAGGRATGARPASGASATGTPVPGGVTADRRLASSPGIGIADGGIGADAARAKQSLDLAPPVGSAAPMPPLGDVRSTSQQIDTGGPTPASASRPDLDAAARTSDLPVSGTAPTLLSTAAAPPKASPHASSSSTPAVPAPSAAAPARSAAPARRPSPALIGLTVVGLGAAAFFVFRYFASQSTQTASTSAIAVAVSPAGPAPEGNPPSAPRGTPEAPPSAAAEADFGPGAAPPRPGEHDVKEARPQGAGPGEAAPGSAPPVGAAPAQKMGAASGAAPKEGAAPKAAAEPGPDNQAARTVAAAEAAGTGGARKGNKRKVAKVAGSAGDVAPPEGGDKPASSESAKAAAGDAPAPPEGAAPEESAAAGHQIRVTSKPPGAEVAIDGQPVGQTPLSTSIADVSSPHFLSVRKEGFETFEQMISATSAWAKTKGAKGQPAVPTLKINAKLKASGAAPAAGATGDTKPAPAATEGTKAAAAGGDSAPASPPKEPPATAPPKMEETKADKTMAPGGADERAPTAP
ncbi:MAG TPA: PEGA domain-containing protein, partial [Polyangia bacterium]